MSNSNRTRIVVAGNWRYTKCCSWTTDRPPKRQSAIKDKQMLSLYVCIRIWEKLDVSLESWKVNVASVHKILQCTNVGTSAESRGIKRTKRDPVSLRTSSGVPLSTSYVIICSNMTQVVFKVGSWFWPKIVNFDLPPIFSETSHTLVLRMEMVKV